MGELIDTDIAIIGGGPGGYTAAIRASHDGFRVVLVEKDTIGGTCLNRGCIPTKALLKSVKILELTRKAGNFGIETGEIHVDFNQIAERKDAVVKKMVTGVRNLLKGNGVSVIKGDGRLVSPRQVEVTCPGGEIKSVQAKHIILAPGSLPATLPIPGADGKSVLDSTGILALTAIPRSLAIIGGGVIGLEFASIFAGLGSKVTILEAQSGILFNEDKDVIDVLKRSMKKSGVSVIEGAAVKSISGEGNGKTVKYEIDGNATTAETEMVLIAVGRRPNTAGLGLEDSGIDTKRGWITVNNRMETSQPGIYAIGDATGHQPLAHVAFAQAEVAIDNIMGHQAVMDYNLVPHAIYTLPELASAGLTEKQARETCEDVLTGKFPFIGNGRAVTMDETAGMVKVISKSNGEILGIHICGPGATELIAEAVAVMQMKGSVDDLGKMIHAHPTLSEAIREAALDTTGKAIHILSKHRTRS